MTSTRNKNTPGNYYLHERDLALARNYEVYEPAVVPERPAFPALGYRPTHMSRDTLSNNSVDIESFLYGINSTNLVNPQPPVKPQLKTVPTIDFFERLPIIMPLPLVVEKNQRPYPI